MVRKKHVQRTLDGRQRSMIENALYAANPPEASRAAVVVHPPMLEYIWRLLYKDLNKSNTEKVWEAAELLCTCKVCVHVHVHVQVQLYMHCTCTCTCMCL